MVNTNMKNTAASGIVEAARAGRVTTVFCSNVAEGRQQLLASVEGQTPLPTLIELEWDEAPSLTKELLEIQEALAKATASLWPDWYLGSEGTRRPQTPEQAWEGSAAAQAQASRSWFNEAWRRCTRGELPIVQQMTASEQIRQMGRAIDPSQLLITLSVVSERAGAARIRSLAKAAEWLARETSCRTLLVLPAAWREHRELDHVNYGALCLEADQPLANPGDGQSTPPSARSTEASPLAPTKRQAKEPHVTLGHVIGRPHPGSPVELSMYEQLESDPELNVLFEYNQRLAPADSAPCIVDLLWREGRLIVEFDGPEHHSHWHYVQDRKRDYRFLLEGFITLRIANDEVCTDSALVREKIRRVVEMRRTQMKGNA